MRKMARLLALLAVVVVNGGWAEQQQQLLILHTNDMHARFEETSIQSGTCTAKLREKKECYGGFGRLAHEIRRFRRRAKESGEGRKVLFLNAGDTFTGTSWYVVHRSKICVDFMNLLQPDAVCLGNHEFDNGVSGLEPFVNKVNAPFVAANLDFTPEPSLKQIKKSVIIDVDGHKIGIIGYLTGDTMNISNPGKIVFSDEVAAVKNESEALHKQGVNIIIALGHSGYLIDQRVAREVPLVDLVIGGHTNTFLWNGSPPNIEARNGPYPTVITQASGKKVPVVQAFAYTKYLGYLNVTFDDAGDLTAFAGQPLLLDSSIPQDEDVLQLLDEYRSEINELERKIVGQSRVFLEGDARCRVSECNFGNLITDACVHYVAFGSPGEYWTNYPIAIANGGGIRSSINATNTGYNISRSDLLSVLPFDNQMVAFSLNGSDLIKTLEIGVRGNGETSRGEFLQVSGLHVVYDLSQPTGHRVVSVNVRCGRCSIPSYSPLILNATYNIVAPRFLLDGGDGHHVLRDASFDEMVQDLNDIDVVEWYFSKMSPVYAEVQGRITFVPTAPTTDGASTKHSSVLLLVVGYIFVVLIKVFI